MDVARHALAADKAILMKWMRFKLKNNLTTNCVRFDENKSKNLYKKIVKTRRPLILKQCHVTCVRETHTENIIIFIRYFNPFRLTRSLNTQTAAGGKG